MWIKFYLNIHKAIKKIHTLSMQTLCLHVLCFYQLLLLEKPRVASLSCINKNIRRVEPVIGNVVEHFNLLSANPTK